MSDALSLAAALEGFPTAVGNAQRALVQAAEQARRLAQRGRALAELTACDDETVAVNGDAEAWAKQCDQDAVLLDGLAVELWGLIRDAHTARLIDRDGIHLVMEHGHAWRHGKDKWQLRGQGRIHEESLHALVRRLSTKEGGAS